MLKILDLKTNHRSEPLGIDGVPYFGWKLCSSKKNVLIYSGKRNAFVLPKEAIGEQYDTLVTLVQKNMPKKKVKL